MKDKKESFDKRMADIPKPIPIGSMGMTEEQLKKGEEEMNRLLKKFGIIKDDE